MTNPLSRCCLAVFLVSFPALAFGEGIPAPRSQPDMKEYKRSLAAGLAYTGIYLHKGFQKNYAVETRYLIGTAGSSDNDVFAHVFGLRGHRYFRAQKRLKPYAGLEGDYILAETRIQKGSGYAAGGYAGLEYYLNSRFSLGFDLGPYYVWFKEKDLGTSDGGVDFVLSTSVNFYLF